MVACYFVCHCFYSGSAHNTAWRQGNSKTHGGNDAGLGQQVGGIILYAVIYITIFSVLLFYANQVKIIKSETIKASVTYSFIQPWGPKAIDGFASVIPFFKDMFTQLEGFFSRIPEKISV